jgi:hypothetical protein
MASLIVQFPLTTLSSAVLSTMMVADKTGWATTKDRAKNQDPRIAFTPDGFFIINTPLGLSHIWRD